MHVLHVVGARPNFMKVAPVHAAFRKRPKSANHWFTGQHYDANLSDIFFEQLRIRALMSRWKSVPAHMRSRLRK